MAGREDAAQHALDDVRKPRVHITYDVEVDGAIRIKELPFVVGVLGEFAGQPSEPLPSLTDRKFVDISLDNFDAVMKGLKPRLALSVKNSLSGDPEAPNLKVVLNFESMDSFSPFGVVRQVKPLNELLELRSNLADLRGSLQGNDKLESMLRDALTDPDKLETLRTQLAALKQAREAEASKG